MRFHLQLIHNQLRTRGSAKACLRAATAVVLASEWAQIMSGFTSNMFYTYEKENQLMISQLNLLRIQILLACLVVSVVYAFI